MTLINPTSALAAQVDGLTADQIADGETRVSMTVGERADLEASVSQIRKARGAMGIVTTGRPSITDVSSNACVAATYIFANPVRHSGTRHTLRLRRVISGSFTIYLGRFTFDGTNFQQVPGTAYVPVTVQGVGNLAATISMYVARGEYLGFSIPGTGNVGPAYNASLPGDSGGYYAAVGVDRPAGVFTTTGKVTSIQLQIGIDGDYALAFDDVTANLQPQIDAHSAGIAASQAAAASVNSKIAGITTTEMVDALARVAAGYTSFPTGSPSSLSWAPGFMGTDLAASSVITAITAVVHRGAGIATFEARLFSRASTKLTVPDANDTAEWADWVSVSADGVAEGAFGEVPFPAQTSLISNTSKAYYLAIRAKNASGTIVPMGCGSVGDGSASNQVQRGFYRNSGDTAWVGIGTTQMLGLRVKVTAVKIAATALPSTPSSGSTGPSKSRAMLLMLGRAELTFDNTGLNTFRRVFALPSNVKRVTRVIFAHATGTAQAITRAAIAPLASAANYAAAGAKWTPLTFGSGTEAGTMPARPGTQRFGYLASLRNPVDLVARTDVPGAAKLVVVSAYMGGGGSPILLGRANDSYKANWEARADFPMVMRHQAGDAVSTPANFTATTNDDCGTPIAGLEVECDDGELMTIGFVGDSVTNGAGISSGGVQQYGKGWAETVAYGLNSKRRGVVPVLLGWSGLTMAGIGGNVADLYTFAKAQGLPVPNILFAPNASPNSMPVPNTLAAMNAQRVISDTIIGTALGAGSQVVTWTALPVDPSVKDFNATDSFRRDYNDADRAVAGLQTGAVLAEYANAVSGGTDADGQELFNDDYEDDGIHPNAAGYAVLAAVGTRSARAVMPAAGYAVGGVVT